MRNSLRTCLLIALVAAMCLAFPIARRHASLASAPLSSTGRYGVALPGNPVGQPGAGMSLHTKSDPVVASTEAERFDAILCCWREDVRPDPGVANLNAYHSDGPLGNRIHVPVPAGCEGLYRSFFSETFLRDQLDASDPLIRRVAQDLRLLRRRRLFSYPGSMGVENERVIDCTFVVVQGEQPGVER